MHGKDIIGLHKVALGDNRMGASSGIITNYSHKGEHEGYI
jgi:hypothetical protein